MIDGYYCKFCGHYVPQPCAEYEQAEQCPSVDTIIFPAESSPVEQTEKSYGTVS